jgi:hypothetical protein
MPTVGEALPDIVTFTCGLMRLHGGHHSFKMLIFFTIEAANRYRHRAGDVDVSQGTGS